MLNTTLKILKPTKNDGNYFKNNLNFYLLPMFILIAFSGNPLFTGIDNSKAFLVIYSLIFTVYVYRISGDWFLQFSKLKRLFFLTVFILLIAITQDTILGFASYPAVLAFILKLVLCYSTLYYYKIKRINIFSIYIKILVFLAIVSLPFFILNQFAFLGIDYGNDFTKSLFLYTSYSKEILNNETIIRNSGMFWEPGAFAGYLNLAILFIYVLNGNFSIKKYKKQFSWIVIAVLTTMSTTGYLSLALILLPIFWVNYKRVRFLVFPLALFIIYTFYTSFDFLQNKIDNQYENTLEMEKTDVSNTRFGALNMDLIYIKSQPLIGNGLDSKTRFRYHPWISKDIGHGNGMSNFVASWGIPLFLIWLLTVYRFAWLTTRKISFSLFFSLLLLLMLQGEQFLNFPLFLMFFILPSFISVKSQITKTSTIR